ncbi:MAG: exonuclease domain-containing protein [bacterium]
MEIKDFIAFDVETASSNPASICQVGYVKVRNLKIIESRSYLVQPPGNEYRAFNSNIHGISALETEISPAFPEVWKKIKNDFKSHLLVAHNASFDASALISALAYYNIKQPKLDIACTYQLTKLKLNSLCQSLRVCLDDHHDALSDAEACANCLIKLIKGDEPDESLIIDVESINPFQSTGHERLHGDILKPDLDVENKENPFYAKKIVLTGVLSTMTRHEAANILKSLGADIDTAVTKRTNYVLAGSGAGPSKLKKIEQYNNSGSEIIIIREKEFLDLIK